MHPEQNAPTTGAGFEAHISQDLLASVDARLEVLKSVFYRNKGAYWVGRFVGDGQVYPWWLPWSMIKVKLRSMPW